MPTKSSKISYQKKVKYNLFLAYLKIFVSGERTWKNEVGWGDLEEAEGKDIIIKLHCTKIFKNYKEGKNFSQAMIKYNKEGNQSENSKRTLVWMSSATRHLRKPVRKTTENSYKSAQTRQTTNECSVGAWTGSWNRKRTSMGETRAIICISCANTSSCACSVGYVRH